MVHNMMFKSWYKQMLLLDGVGEIKKFEFSDNSLRRVCKIVVLYSM